MLQSKISQNTTIYINKSDNITIKKTGSVGGYDGHSLRAYSYFQDELPDIQQVSDETICYKIVSDEKEYYVTDIQEINYQGTVYTGKQLHDFLQGIV